MVKGNGGGHDGVEETADTSPELDGDGRIVDLVVLQVVVAVVKVNGVIVVRVQREEGGGRGQGSGRGGGQRFGQGSGRVSVEGAKGGERGIVAGWSIGRGLERGHRCGRLQWCERRWDCESGE